MKKIVFILSALLPFTKNNAQSFGPFASAVFISQNGQENAFNVTGEGVNLIGTAPFSGDLGSYQQNSGNLVFNGGEVKTYKDNGANVCGATVYYSVHLAGSVAPFTSFSLPYKAGCSGGTFTDGLGACSGNDQKWSSEAGAADLTNNMPGDYEMDVYIDIPGSYISDAACDATNSIGNNMAFAGTMSFSIISQPLSIQINSFAGKTDHNVNTIDWKMNDEVNLASYQLEKSTDGARFQTIANLPVNTSLKGYYNAEDVASSNRKNLYRLKLTDKNNNATYSNVITLNDKMNHASVTALPNPAKDFVTVTSTVAEPAVISIFNIGGKNFRKFNTQSAETKIDLSGFSSGVYIITYKSAHASQIIKVNKL